MRRIIIYVLMLSAFSAGAQFAPAAGKPGSTAVQRDSSAIVAWATGCTVTRGLRDVSRPDSGYATTGVDSLVKGKSDGATVSLGDGGSAIVTFENAIVNGAGDDFAVFENSFDGLFLELAFVEVSSDGIKYVRFPPVSNTQDTIQKGSFANSDPTLINNLAGKYKVFYGTPFDLQELADSSQIDINHVTHVRIIDVVGCIQDIYATYDINGNKINDPWTTRFAAGGFDLDAVGVLHQDVTGINKHSVSAFSLHVFPNPVNSNSIVQFNLVKPADVKISLIDLQGREVALLMNRRTDAGMNEIRFNSTNLVNGIYFLQLNVNGISETKKIVIENE